MTYMYVSHTFSLCVCVCNIHNYVYTQFRDLYCTFFFVTGYFQLTISCDGDVEKNPKGKTEILGSMEAEVRGRAARMALIQSLQ